MKKSKDISRKIWLALFSFLIPFVICFSIFIYIYKELKQEKEFLEEDICIKVLKYEKNKNFQSEACF